MFKRIEISPDKINNIYALLGAFLFTSEGLLGFWFSKANNSAERIVAGGLMAVILIGFMILVYKIKIAPSDSNKPRVNEKETTTASKEVSQEELKAVPAEQLAGPGSTYTIDMPPAYWKTKQLDITGLLLENFDLEMPGYDLKNIPEDQRTILSLQSNINYEIFPIPGKTTINGRILPAALSSIVKIKLSIIPIERLQPPFYIESSFAQNVYTLMGDMLKSGLFSLENTISGVIEHSKREFIQMDMVQRLEHVDFSIGQETLADCTGVKNNISIVGIKGDIIDHILLLSYPNWPSSNLDSSFNQELAILRNIFSSFKPLKVSNPVERLNKIKEKANKNYENAFSQSSVGSFDTEFEFALRRISALNPKNPADQKRIIMILKPFHELYKLIKMEDDELNEIWSKLEEAEKGNIQPLMDAIEPLIEDIEDADMDVVDDAAQPKVLDNG